MRNICVAFVLAVLLFTTSVVFGEEAAVAINTGDQVVFTTPEWLFPFFGGLAALVGSLISWGILKIVGLAIKDQVYKDAIDALRIGVENTQVEVVRALKEANADGRLTKEEIAKVQKIAYEEAMKVAKGPALELLKSWGIDRAKGYMGQIVDKKNDTQ